MLSTWFQVYNYYFNFFAEKFCQAPVLTNSYVSLNALPGSQYFIPYQGSIIYTCKSLYTYDDGSTIRTFVCQADGTFAFDNSGTLAPISDCTSKYPALNNK